MNSKNKPKTINLQLLLIPKTKNLKQSINYTLKSTDFQKICPKNLLLFSLIGITSINIVTNFIPPLSRGGRGCVHQLDGLYTKLTIFFKYFLQVLIFRYLLIKQKVLSKFEDNCYLYPNLKPQSLASINDLSSIDLTS